GPACVVECLLPRLGVGALSGRLLGRGRETQKQQECGADQSRDCGAGLLAIERASLHVGPFSGLAAARYHTVTPERRCASQQKLGADVADGSKADSSERGHPVRFTPESGQTADVSICLLCAKKRTNAAQQNTSLFDHLVGAGEQSGIRRFLDGDMIREHIYFPIPWIGRHLCPDPVRKRELLASVS